MSVLCTSDVLNQQPSDPCLWYCTVLLPHPTHLDLAVLLPGIGNVEDVEGGQLVPHNLNNSSSRGNRSGSSRGSASKHQSQAVCGERVPSALACLITALQHCLRQASPTVLSQTVPCIWIQAARATNATHTSANEHMYITHR